MAITITFVPEWHIVYLIRFLRWELRDQGFVLSLRDATECVNMVNKGRPLIINLASFSHIESLNNIGVVWHECECEYPQPYINMPNNHSSYIQR